MHTDNLQQSSDEQNQRFTDQHTDDRIHQHLNNKNDEISEEDIRNVRTDIGQQGEPAKGDPPEPPQLPKAPDKSETPTEPVKDNSDPDVKTSWNILGG